MALTEGHGPVHQLIVGCKVSDQTDLILMVSSLVVLENSFKEQFTFLTSSYLYLPLVRGAPNVFLEPTHLGQDAC